MPNKLDNQKDIVLEQFMDSLSSEMEAKLKTYFQINWKGALTKENFEEEFDNWLGSLTIFQLEEILKKEY